MPSHDADLEAGLGFRVEADAFMPSSRAVFQSQRTVALAMRAQGERARMLACGCAYVCVYRYIHIYRYIHVHM